MASQPNSRPVQPPNADGKFSISEDWLAFAVCLVLSR